MKTPTAGPFAFPGIGLLGLLVALGFLAGCNHGGSPANTRPSKAKLQRNVELGQAERRALDYFVETVGIIEAEGQTDIAAGVSGVVDEVLFREGQWVEKGTILVKVDQRRYTAAAEVARASEKRAVAGVDLARDLEARIRISGKGVSDEDRSKAVLGLRAAEADLLAAQAARVLAESNLDRSQVRAPYAGQLNSRKVTPGTYLEDKTMVATLADLRQLRLVGWVPEKAASTVRTHLAFQELSRSIHLIAAAGSGPSPWNVVAALLRDGAGATFGSLGREVSDLTLASRLFGAAAVRQGPWSVLAEIARDRWTGDASSYGLEFTVLAYPRRTLLGRIFYLSTVASPETHMFECKAEANTAGLNLDLRPGYTARIRVPLRSNANACVVPEEAVRATERGFVAYVPTQKTGRDGETEWVASARQLELGYRAYGKVEVLRGLAPGEWIVTKGAEALENGTPLRIPEKQLEQMAGPK